MDESTTEDGGWEARKEKKNEEWRWWEGGKRERKGLNCRGKASGGDPRMRDQTDSWTRGIWGTRGPENWRDMRVVRKHTMSMESSYQVYGVFVSSHEVGQVKSYSRLSQVMRMSIKTTMSTESVYGVCQWSLSKKSIEVKAKRQCSYPTTRMQRWSKFWDAPRQSSPITVCRANRRIKTRRLYLLCQVSK